RADGTSASKARAPGHQDAEPIRLPHRRGSAHELARHRPGRTIPLRPWGLRDDGRLPAGSAAGGRLPHPSDGRQYRGADRTPVRGAHRDQRPIRPATVQWFRIGRGPDPPSLMRRHGAADRRHMKARLWLVYAAAGVAMLLVYLFVPGARLGPLFNIIGLTGALAIVVGVRVHKPAQRLPWLLVALGQTLFVGGDVITYNYHRFFGTEAPFPSYGDALYLAVYPFLVIGILLLIRRRNPGGDRTGLIDSLIVAVGIGAMSWIFLIAPYIHAHDLSLQQKLVAMAYPIMDLILFSVFVRLAVGSGRRHAAFYLISASVLTLFVTDSIYGWIVLHGNYNNSTGYLELGWGLFYILWGAGALHPTMRSLDERYQGPETSQPRRRLLLLASASLLSPLVQLIQAVRQASVYDEVAMLAACSIVLFILVLIR